MKDTATKHLKPTTFHIHAEPDSRTYVTGSFNHWNGASKSMADVSGFGDYRITLMLPPGRHEYKFVVNDRYLADPECTQWTVNEFGTLNSVINV